MCSDRTHRDVSLTRWSHPSDGQKGVDTGAIRWTLGRKRRSHLPFTRVRHGHLPHLLGGRRGYTSCYVVADTLRQSEPRGPLQRCDLLVNSCSLQHWRQTADSDRPCRGTVHRTRRVWLESRCSYYLRTRGWVCKTKHVT